MSPHRIILASLPSFCQKLSNWWKFDDVLTKTILHSFFETRCILLHCAPSMLAKQYIVLVSCVRLCACRSATICLRARVSAQKLENC